MFEDVAQTYDKMNDCMSFGIHRIWKDIFMQRLSPVHGTRLLDVGGGTGMLHEGIDSSHLVKELLEGLITNCFVYQEILLFVTLSILKILHPTVTQTRKEVMSP